MFHSEIGTVIEPGNVYRDFKKVLCQAGLPDTIRFHDLRHSCATFLIAQHVHLSAIKDILGHTKIDTTADIYGHVLEEVQRASLATLDDLFDDPTMIELPPRKVRTGHKGRERGTFDS